MVIEDLISTGGSSLKAVAALENGARVLGMMAIFAYGFCDMRIFEEASVRLNALSDYHLLGQTVQSGAISLETRDLLSEWRKNPSVWGK